MTDTEAKALALVNEIAVERGGSPVDFYGLEGDIIATALCRAIEREAATEARHAAELRELKDRFSEAEDILIPFILPAPDPLVDELALAIDQFLTHRIERDTLACDLTQDELTELATGIAAIAAMQQAQQWQGIESAPRDGTPFLIWSYGRIGFAFIDPREHDGVKFHRSSAAIIGPDPYNDMRPGIAVSDHYLKTATHWMPLPTPPNGGSDAAS